ncbi:MAG: hypothetical protein GOU99_01505 [Candidatus Altiarchaeota archaeon]|nr:hypothetical protein [Candidatus Altiarchaeota archaeon]
MAWMTTYTGENAEEIKCKVLSNEVEIANLYRSELETQRGFDVDANGGTELRMRRIAKHLQSKRRKYDVQPLDSYNSVFIELHRLKFIPTGAGKPYETLYAHDPLDAKPEIIPLKIIHSESESMLDFLQKTKIEYA